MATHRHKRVMLHGACQTRVAQPLFSNRLSYDQGFLPRCLGIGTGFLPPAPISDYDIGLDPASQIYGLRIQALLGRPLRTCRRPTRETGLDGLLPGVTPVSPA